MDWFHSKTAGKNPCLQYELESNTMAWLGIPLAALYLIESNPLYGFASIALSDAAQYLFN